jgi:predicted ATPase
MLLYDKFQGCGKTALARSIQSTVLEHGGYFIRGKFDQTHRPEPYAAFVAALTEFCKCVISRGPTEIASLRNNIDKLIKSEHRVLLNMVPALKLIFTTPTADNDSTTTKIDNIGTDAVNKFKHVFRMFMGAISSNGKPIVFLLDDIHWADESSLELLYTLLAYPKTSEGILYMATYRIDEPSDILRQYLHKFRDDSIRLSVINLDNFSVPDLNSMLADMLNTEEVQCLADRIYRQTKGNIYFVLEYLLFLRSKSLLVLDENDNNWKWSDDDECYTTSGSLHDLLISMIRSTTESTREFLIYAACLGTKLDENILRHLVSGSVSTYIQEVATKGWLNFDKTDECWKFSHDAIKEATYQLIPTGEIKTFHYQIGRKLWLELSLDEVDRYIFVVTSQLLVGIDLMVEQEERTAIAKLCLRAGERSVEISHFQIAFEYLTNGISLLGLRAWRDEYDFCLQLHNATAEVAFCIGNYDAVYKLVAETLKHARVYDDTIQAHCTKLNSLCSNGQLKDAVSYALVILDKLNEPIPQRFIIARLLSDTWKLRKTMKNLIDDDILGLPLMQDQSKLAAMKVMDAIILPTVLTHPLLLPFVGMRLVSISLKYGVNAISARGLIVCGIYLIR